MPVAVCVTAAASAGKKARFGIYKDANAFPSPTQAGNCRAAFRSSSSTVCFNFFHGITPAAPVLARGVRCLGRFRGPLGLRLDNRLEGEPGTTTLTGAAALAHPQTGEGGTGLSESVDAVQSSTTAGDGCRPRGPMRGPG